jgi:uncharacterized protein DUF6370
MVKLSGRVALGLALALVMAVAVKAEEKKEVTLKGTILCGKCALKETPKCHTAIKVKEGDKEVVYFFDETGSKKYHKEICTETKEGEVTGVTGESDGKKTIKVSKVEFK